MGEEFLSAVFTFPLTRLVLISEVRVEPRDGHYSKTWVITSLCTHALECLSGNASCIWNTNAPLSLIWATRIIKLKIQLSWWKRKQHSQQFTIIVNKSKQQFNVFQVAVNLWLRLLWPVFKVKWRNIYDNVWLEWSFMKSLTTTYTNSWYLKETEKMQEFEKPVDIGTAPPPTPTPPPSLTSARNSSAVPEEQIWRKRQKKMIYWYVNDLQFFI